MNFPVYRAVKRGHLIPNDLIPDTVLLALQLDISMRNFHLFDATYPYSLVADTERDWIASVAEVIKGWDSIATNPPFDNCWIELSDADDKFNVGIALCRVDEGIRLAWRMLIFTQPWGKPYASAAPGTFTYEWNEEGLLQPKAEVRTWADSDEAEQSVRLQFCLSSTAIVAFSLAHCKNVELVERLPKRHEQREAKRRGEPILKYHEIVIDPGKTKQVAIGAGSSRQDTPSRALHIARGHFATYTPDRPLFGKFTGTYWRPAHVRGSADLGAVKSTYKVKGIAA